MEIAERDDRGVEDRRSGDVLRVVEHVEEGRVGAPGLVGVKGHSVQSENEGPLLLKGCRRWI